MNQKQLERLREKVEEMMQKSEVPIHMLPESIRLALNNLQKVIIEELKECLLAAYLKENP